jgi:hypothetical protein
MSVLVLSVGAVSFLSGYAVRGAREEHASLSVGSLDGWVAGLLTGLGLMITGYQIRQNRIDAARREAERRKANVRGVVVSTWSVDESTHGQSTLHGVVTNSGELPVFYVRVSVDASGRPIGSARVGTISAGGSQLVRITINRPIGRPEEFVTSLRVQVRLQDSFGTLWVSGEDRLEIEPHGNTAGA